MFGQRKENILVIKADSLGAFVAAEPVFAGLRERYADAEISLLTLSSLQRIARAAPYFDQVAALPDFSNLIEKKAFAKQLSGAKFARVFDLSVNENSKRVQSAFGAFGPKWVAAAPASKRTRNKSAGDGLPGFDKLCAAQKISPAQRLPDFDWAVSARKDSANMRPSWFGITGAFGLLTPGADPAKRWPAASYGQFAQICAQAGVMPVLVGGKSVHSFGDEVCEHAPEVVDLTGKTDHLQLAALAREASFFVSDCAEEVDLALAVGAAGVLIKRAKEADLTPRGRHMMTVTVSDDMGEADAAYVWQYLNNMGLIDLDAPTAAVAR